MKLALIGDPVEHSLSPRLHERFMREAGIDGSYVTIRVSIESCARTIARLREDGFTGCNVTYPLKEEAARSCVRLTQEAELAGCVNTMLFGPEVLGTNTDGLGARLALEAILDESVSLKRVGVLGTGATARALLAQLQENDAYAFVWGRDAGKVATLCERYEAGAWPHARAPEAVVNTLPPGIELPGDLRRSLRHVDVIMDANYGDRAVLGKALGREVIPGDAMLEAQARASFDFWLAHTDHVA